MSISYLSLINHSLAINVEIPMLRHPLYIILNINLILKHFKRMSTTNSAKPNLQYQTLTNGKNNCRNLQPNIA